MDNIIGPSADNPVPESPWHRVFGGLFFVAALIATGTVFVTVVENQIGTTGNIPPAVFLLTPIALIVIVAGYFLGSISWWR